MNTLFLRAYILEGKIYNMLSQLSISDVEKSYKKKYNMMVRFKMAE